MADPALLDEAISPVAGGRTNVRALRDLWAFDQNARVAAFAQTLPGKALLTLLCLTAARVAGMHLLFVAIALTFAWLPRYRNLLILAGAGAAMVRMPKFNGEAIAAILTQHGFEPALAGEAGAAALLVWLVCAWALLTLVRANKSLLPARRPVPSLCGAVVLLCGAASLPMLPPAVRAALWIFVCVFAAYFWFLAYALVDQRSRTPAPMAYQAGILHPFWGGVSTPFGKGAAFLRKHQAKDADELAVTQLKGLKLLLWALLLTAAYRGLVWLFEGRLGIPAPESAYAAFVRGAPLPLWTSWASLSWATFGGTLALAIWGHEIIAVARMAGYRLPRNTWRPLESRTLAEFWNRYYYYFKELLVEFFFFPTFLRTFRKHPRLRVFFATFMAAGVGNALYHFIRDIRHVALFGLEQTAANFASYLFYCFVLAAGIGISQARTNAGRRLPQTLAGSLWSMLCVWSFFICLQVFGDETRSLSLGERFAYFASLFGAG